MQSFDIANGTTICLRAPLVVWLEGSKQLVKSVTVVSLLIRNASVRDVVTAGCIFSKAVFRKSNGCIPVLELELFLSGISFIPQKQEDWCGTY